MFPLLLLPKGSSRPSLCFGRAKGRCQQGSEDEDEEDMLVVEKKEQFKS